MKRIIISSAVFLVIGLSSYAQKGAAPPPPQKKHSQSITIRTDGSKNEKTTIVIDGDKVTVNGKPLDDYHGDLQIFENDNPDFGARLMPAMPPMPPQGGAKMFTRNFKGFGNEAFLGVSSESDEGGATISSVSKGSAAEKAGLKEGDVITKVDKEDIDGMDDLTEAIGDHKPGDTVSITYQRDKKTATVSAVLGKSQAHAFVWNDDNDNVIRNFNFDFADRKPRLGMRVQDMENSSGVKVIDLDDDGDSPASKAGLKEDDVITQVNGKTVQSVKDVKDALADAKPGDDIKITYQRNGSSQTATVHLPKPLQTSDL